MKLSYDHNNSGGSWWLSDDDWHKMEEAGWNVEWGGLYYCNSKFPSMFGRKLPLYMSDPCKNEGCPGHRLARTYEEAKTVPHFLGAFADGASIETDDPEATVREWETLLGQSVGEGGCQCCGPPHSFSWTDDKGEYHHASASYYAEESWT